MLCHRGPYLCTCVQLLAARVRKEKVDVKSSWQPMHLSSVFHSPTLDSSRGGTWLFLNLMSVCVAMGNALSYEKEKK